MSRAIDHWLMATLAVAAIGLVACGDDDSAEVRTVTVTTTEPATQGPAAVDGGDAILIETRISDGRTHKGKVTDGSVIGESAFCAGGTTSGGGQVPIITTFSCPDGSLTVKFAVTQRSSVQSAIWEVVRGTGTFKGLKGGGSMVARFDGEDPDVGQEMFVGTVGR